MKAATSVWNVDRPYEQEDSAAMKKSGWSIAGVLAYLAIRFGALAMRHPDWNANDWAGFLGITAILLVVILSIIWLVKKLRSPKPSVAASLASGAMTAPAILASAPAPQFAAQLQPQNVPAATLAATGSVCSHCGSQFEAGSNFCCECGGLVA
jgi:hypothetical protein